MAQLDDTNVNASLFVTNLDSAVTEWQLLELFKPYGRIISCKILLDKDKKSKGKAYINFIDRYDADSALQLNNHPLVGKRISVEISNPTKMFKTGNLYVKCLSADFDELDLYELFSPFGNVVSHKIERSSDGKSKGFGYIQLENEKDAEKAINVLNGKLIEGQHIYVGFHLNKSERQKQLAEKFTNIYVKNLPNTYNDDDLKTLFIRFGPIVSAKVEVHERTGNSLRFGFVNFSNHDDAATAVCELNNCDLNGKKLYVGRAQNAEERQKVLKNKQKSSQRESRSSYQQQVAPSANAIRSNANARPITGNDDTSLPGDGFSKMLLPMSLVDSLTETESPCKVNPRNVAVRSYQRIKDGNK